MPEKENKSPRRAVLSVGRSQGQTYWVWGPLWQLFNRHFGFMNLESGERFKLRKLWESSPYRW